MTARSVVTPTRLAEREEEVLPSGIEAAMTSLDNSEVCFIAKTPDLSKESIQSSGTGLACVMVSYRTGDLLFASLAALLEQSLPPAEVVLVDNGNPPEVEARLDALAETTPALRIVRGQGNVGFSSACNLGASLCSSPRLLFLNPDCLLPADALLHLHDEFAQLPPKSLLSPLLVNEDFSEQRGSRRMVLTPWRALVEWTGLYRLAPAHPYFLRFNRMDDPLPLSTHPVDVTSGAAMLLERSLFEELGGFDEQYFLHVEDIDLCVSLRKRNGSAYVAPAIRVVHYGGSSESKRIVVEWHKARGFCRYFRKQFSAVYPLGFVSIVNVLVWLRFLVRIPKLALTLRQRPGVEARQSPGISSGQSNSGD